MKDGKNILIGVLAVLVVLGISKNFLIKSAVTLGASQVLGAPVEIDSFGFGIFKQSVRIKGFRIYNPPGFPKAVMLDIPEVRVDYRLGDLLGGKLRLPLVVFNLKEMVIIKNKEGKLNVDSLKVAQKGEDKGSKETPQKKSGTMPMQIDVATLNLGKVIVKDYTLSDPPAVQAYDIGVNNKNYTDINSAEQFATLVMVTAMGPTALKGAAIYGAAAILGVGFLPAGVAGVLLGKDDSTAEYSVSFDKVYAAARKLLEDTGRIEQEIEGSGILKGKSSGANITIEVTRKDDKIVTVKVTARQMMLPKPEIALGFLYQLSEKLK